MEPIGYYDAEVYMTIHNSILYHVYHFEYLVLAGFVLKPCYCII